MARDGIMYDDILIPTDGSDGSRAAVEHGVTLAGRFDATVHALSVVDEAFSKADVADDTVWMSIYEERERDGERATELIATTAADVHDVSVVQTIYEGDPAETILAYIDEHAIDLVVMGTHGRTGIGRHLLGSVTTTVVRAASIPVLTVRLTKQLQTTDYADILIATDGTPSSEAAARHAVALADRYDATLHAIYVVDSKYGTSDVIRNSLRQLGNEAIENVTRQAASLDHPPIETIAAGVPYEEIIAHSENQGIDLIVLGTHDRTGIDHLVMGSVAERIIRTAHTPVLTVSTETEHDRSRE